ncbi:CHC2 zinc finger domain-containing protein [Amycolatopsis sp. NPDC088138]|uniref:CHC2 zinc finger domain-containing protein n=1 Tax=Amycolatopsis sp. NPDC088138 TaxID=3363938 RepID=UPI0038209D39
MRGDCPFCRSRMFRVRPGHGTFHCHGCGVGGDARMFAAEVRRIRNTSRFRTNSAVFGFIADLTKVIFRYVR